MIVGFRQKSQCTAVTFSSIPICDWGDGLKNANKQQSFLMYNIKYMD